MLGNDIEDAIGGKSVIDFGCGEGNEVIEMARRGASRVTGVDIREDQLETARRRATAAGVADRCVFLQTTSEAADIITTIDAFEHFGDPAAILQIMFSLLKPGGEVLFSFGRTWFHPLGGHLFSVFPWAHVLFSEEALIRWRSDFKDDGAQRFHEVAGGLNQMTIGRFERLVAESGFQMARFECVQIRGLKPLHSHVTREFTTAVCRGRLKRTA
jgi:SAM-dependent methyltransferase